MFINQNTSVATPRETVEDISLRIPVEVEQKVRFRTLFIYGLSLIIFGVIADGLALSTMGLREIIMSPGVLISDYVEIAGIGAAFLNAGLVSLIALLIIKVHNVKITGPIIAAFFTIAGFALFGKNILNILPIIFGVWVYAKYQGRKFSDCILPALFGTALGPLISKVALGCGFSFPLGIGLGITFGIAIGFVLPPLAAHLAKTHQGYNLYNIGFTAGIIGTMFMSVFRGHGINSESVFFWAKGLNHVFVPVLSIYFVSMIVGGIFLGKIGRQDNVPTLRNIISSSGGLATDFVSVFGFGPTLINMGLMGIIGMLYVVLVGGDLNGPTIGGLFTIVGFAAFGKNPKNVIPILTGVYLGTVTKIWDANTPGALLAALFGTTLAPIAGTFGPIAGVVAGFLHLSVVMNVGYLHGATNLYNNGFAGGLVAAVLVPIIQSLKRVKE
jgi:hypothetical protein